MKDDKIKQSTNEKKVDNININLPILWNRLYNYIIKCVKLNKVIKYNENYILNEDQFNN